MATFRIITLGCKVNQCESAALARKLTASGWHEAAGEETADLCVVNTCAVTGKAAMQSRQAVRQALRRSPGTRMVVTGCYAQTDPGTLAGIEGVSAVMGNGEKLAIAQTPDFSTGKGPTIQCGPVRDLRSFEPLPGWGVTDRTRPFLKIQDGCNAHCTYCIIPSARGPSRSLPPDQVMDQLRALSRSGFLETVLTGIHLGYYGQDLTPPSTLTDLLRRVDDETAMARIRLSSIEPGELADDILNLVAGSRRFCRHFHIPLQSGDDTVLKRMARPYDSHFFRQRILAVRERIPRCALGIDVIAGFPGESDEAFENTYRLLASLPVTYLHVFPFSPRQGTPASKMADPVPAHVAKARCQRLRRLGHKKRAEFYSGFIGETVEVLVEGAAQVGPGMLRGFSDHYLPVHFPGSADLKECLVKVRIDSLGKDQTILGTRV